MVRKLRLKEAYNCDYITAELVDMSGNKILANAYDRDELSVVVRDNVFWLEQTPSKKVCDIAIREVKRLFPDLTYIADIKTTESAMTRRSKKTMTESDSVRFPELDARAMELYDARDYRGFSQFTDDELAKLVSMCYTTPDNPWGRAYDDEVFDEITNRDTYDEIHAAGKRYAGITESASRGRIRPRRSMQEARYDLSPQHDARKSFYGKAHVVTDDDGTQILYSYNTPVIELKDGKVKLLPMWDSSQTTLRHVKEFLKQNGFSAGSKGEIARLYGESLRRSHRRTASESIARKNITRRNLKKKTIR